MNVENFLKLFQKFLRHLLILSVYNNFFVLYGTEDFSSSSHSKIIVFYEIKIWNQLGPVITG